MEDEQWRTVIQWEMQHAKDHEGAGPTAEERQKFLQGFRTSLARETPDMEFLRKYQEEHPDAKIEDAYGALSDEKRRQKVAAGGGGNTTLTNDRRIAAEVAKKTEQWKQEGKGDDEINELAAKETRRLRAMSAAPTDANREKSEAHIQQFDNSLKKIESVTGVLDKYAGAAGVAGKATRMAERVRDIFGSKDTDRVQFMRDIDYLKSEAPQLLFDRAGRPLAAEADRLNDIIGGLSAGDTTANTMRSLKEIQTLYKKMQKDAQARLKGDFHSDSSGAPAEDAKPKPKPKPAPWQNDPEVK